MYLDIIKKLFCIESNCGYSENDLNYWIEKYDTMPKVLKEYYMEVGKHHKLNNTQDFLIPPAQFEEYADTEYLVFYSENQGASLWGIKKSDVEKDNPPVYENYGDEEWFLTANSLSQFLLSMAYLQAVFSMEYANEECVDITEEQHRAISNYFSSKQADSDLYTGVSFYGNHDDTVIVVMKNHDYYILMYSSNSELHFDEMDRAIEQILLN